MILLTEGESMSRLFDLDWQLLADSCLMIIAIFFLFLILSYFLFNPARKMLEGRKEKIRNELETAKTAMQNAQSLKKEYEAKLKDVDKEAEVILSEARRKALANENAIVAEAREEAARILDRARVEAGEAEDVRRREARDRGRRIPDGRQDRVGIRGQRHAESADRRDLEGNG